MKSLERSMDYREHSDRSKGFCSGPAIRSQRHKQPTMS